MAAMLGRRALANAAGQPICCGARFMENARRQTLHFKRSHFATQLPVAYRYTLSHAWIEERSGGICRVGFTRFATRMLGEMVDHGLEIEPGATVEPGQIVGWVEGFKAISDLYCVAEGEFAGANPALKDNIALLGKDPYGEGWIYEVNGRPDVRCVDVIQYRDHLDKTIERFLSQRKGEEIK